MSTENVEKIHPKDLCPPGFLRDRKNEIAEFLLDGIERLFRNKKLSYSQKLLCLYIIILDAKELGVFFTNVEFAKKFNRSARSVGRDINALLREGYIEGVMDGYGGRELRRGIIY